MKFPLFIAKHYLFSRKKKSVINIISWISLVGIAVSTIALIVVLSVYNGIGEITQSLFNIFDPELLIEPAKGKTFHTDSIAYNAIQKLPGVKAISPIVEENAWITHKQNESIVQLRGVDDNYVTTTGLDTMTEGADAHLWKSQTIMTNELTPETVTNYYLLFGSEIYYNLGLNSYSNSPVAVHIPKRGGGLGMTIDEAFNNGYAYAGGGFFVQQEVDSRYVIASINFVRSLMDYSDDEVTALAITTQGPKQTQRVKANVQKLLGTQYKVKDRFEQQPLYYKVFRSERLGVFLILSLIVLISTLNLIASLSLLIIDKRKDIATLRSMGMEQRDIRHTFFAEGMMISLVGVVSGLLLGFLICLAQQQFGIVKMGSNFVVNAFPVAMRAVDFITTFIIVMALSSISIYFTVHKSKI